MHKILIASDREKNRNLLKRICKAHGLLICGEAANLEQTLILSELHLPSIVIFNFRCAIPNQTLLVSQIAQLGRAVKVLVYSALGPSRASHAYIRAGAAGFLSEQNDADELICILRGMIAGFTLVPIKALKQPRIKVAHRCAETFSTRSPINAAARTVSSTQ